MKSPSFFRPAGRPGPDQAGAKKAGEPAGRGLETRPGRGQDWPGRTVETPGYWEYQEARLSIQLADDGTPRHRAVPPLDEVSAHPAWLVFIFVSSLLACDLSI